MIKFKPFRDLMLVEKIEEEKAIILTDVVASHFVRLKLLDMGSEVKILGLKSGDVLIAENVLERVVPGKNLYLILERYVVCKEWEIKES